METERSSPISCLRNTVLDVTAVLTFSTHQPLWLAAMLNIQITVRLLLTQLVICYWQLSKIAD